MMRQTMVHLDCYPSLPALLMEITVND